MLLFGCVYNKCQHLKRAVKFFNCPFVDMENWSYLVNSKNPNAKERFQSVAVSQIPKHFLHLHVQLLSQHFQHIWCYPLWIQKFFSHVDTSDFLWYNTENLFCEAKPMSFVFTSIRRRRWCLYLLWVQAYFAMCL